MMNKLLLVVATALALPACLDDATARSARELSGDRLELDDGATTTTSEEVPVTLPAKRVDVDGDDSPCGFLPQDDSACAHACSDDFYQFIPKGTCTTFVCNLTNGSQYITGGCNW